MKIEYKAIDDSENIYRGVETVKNINELCKILHERQLLPIAIRILGNHSIGTFAHLKHLKYLKKKLEYKVDQDVNIDSIPLPVLPTKGRRRIDPIYALYFIIFMALIVGYYIGF